MEGGRGIVDEGGPCRSTVAAILRAHDGHADAHYHHDDVPTGGERPHERLLHALRQRYGGVLVIDVLGHDRELVAAATGDRVPGSDDRQKTLPGARQHGVSDAVAEHVVEVREPVNVDD